MKKILSLLLLLFVANSAFAQKRYLYVSAIWGNNNVTINGTLPEGMKNKYTKDDFGGVSFYEWFPKFLDLLADYGYTDIENWKENSSNYYIYISKPDSSSTSTDSNKRLRGDVNEDGRVSISDATEVVDIILNPEEKK